MSKEAGWMHQLAAGESTAWTRLLTEWSPRLYHYLTANGVSEAEAQALLHQIFSTLVQQVVGSAAVANPAVLLFAIAYQQIMRYCHRQTNSQRRQAFSPADKTDADPQAIHLRQTLQQFSPEVQQIALLYYLFDLNLAEISQIVRQPELLVRNALNQVRRQLCR